jgi:predicted AAA+ superfamily ATPase
LDFNDFDSSFTQEDKFLQYVKYGGMPAAADYNFNEKVILTQDKNFINSYDGIKIRNVLEFLLESI